jgi:uncharacterized membrane protein
MGTKAAVTVGRPQDEVRRLWETGEPRPEFIVDSGAAVSFRDAPGDRGTEVHVDLGQSSSTGKFGSVLGKATAPAQLGKVKDELRRFKQQAETGGVPRSEASPVGGRRFRQRPAQPLAESELQKAGA